MKTSHYTSGHGVYLPQIRLCTVFSLPACNLHNMRPRTKRHVRKLVNFLVVLLGFGLLLSFFGINLSHPFKSSSKPLNSNTVAESSDSKVASSQLSDYASAFEYKEPDNPVVVDISICTRSRFGSCELPDPTWRIYPKDLLLGNGWMNKMYLIYKHVDVSTLKDEDLVVTGIASTHQYEKPHIPDREKDGTSILPVEMLTESFLDEPTEAEIKENGWVERDFESGLWIQRKSFKKAKQDARTDKDDSRDSVEGMITALKVLYGDDVQYYVPNWNRTSTPLSVGRKYELPYIFYRKGPLVKIPKPEIKLDKSDRLRIAQISDLHMNSGHGICREVASSFDRDVYGECHADRLTLEFMDAALHNEIPDLIVFSGDLLLGAGVRDVETALIKAVSIAMKYKIPFATIWGNHDSETGFSNYELTEILLELPYSLIEHGPESIPGDGNYVVTASKQGDEYPVLSLYMIDTHGRSRDRTSAYDWVKKEQADWVLEQSKAITSQLKGLNDLTISMAFIHIPTPHYVISLDVQRVGNSLEGISCTVRDEGIMSAFFQAGVSIINAGHDHANDFCQYLMENPEFKLDSDIYLCYGGGAGYGGYGGYPDAHNVLYKRRIRFFDVDMKHHSVVTYHFVDKLGGHSNKFVLMEDAIPVPPSVIVDVEHVPVFEDDETRQQYYGDAVDEDGLPIPGSGTETLEYEDNDEFIGDEELEED